MIRTKDREVYRQAKHASKRTYATLAEASRNWGQERVYWCWECQGFHRTSWPVSSAKQVLAMEKNRTAPLRRDLSDRLS